MKVKKLSSRETSIINLMREGLPNNKIAEILEINQKTVSTYVQRLREKLNLEKNCNAYLIVTTYAKLQFPMDD